MCCDPSSCKLSTCSSEKPPERLLIVCFVGEQWLNRISPATWIIYGLAVDQMGENQDVLITPEGQRTTVSAFLASYFGYEYSFRWCGP